MKAAKIASALVLCTMLTGCVTIKENVKVDSDGHYTPSFDMLYRQDLLKTKNPRKEVMSSIDSSLVKKNHLRTSYITEKKDGKKYYGVRITGVKKLNGMTVTAKGRKLTFRMSKFELPGGTYNKAKKTKTDSISPVVLEQAGVTMTLNVTMPRKPATNYGKVKGNTVTINLYKVLDSDGNMKKPVVITSDSGKTSIPVWLGAGIIAAVAVAGTVYFVKTNKKKD